MSQSDRTFVRILNYSSSQNKLQPETQVSDEEAVQVRAMNLLAGLNLRVLPSPESAHAQWGDFLRALDSSKLKLPCLKLTLITNYGRGPWNSGRFKFNAKKAAENLMATCSDDYLDSLAERVSFDLGRAELHTVTRDEWMAAPGIATSIREAPRPVL